MGGQGDHPLTVTSPSEDFAEGKVVAERATGGRDVPAHAYDRWFDKPWGRHAFAVEFEAVRGALPRRSGLRVLDAGCGTGRFAAELADLGATVIGVDADPSMLGLASPRLEGRCARAHVESLPFPDGTFDVVMAITVLEFVSDPATVMAELVRVTRPGGRVVVGALNPHSPWGVANRRRLRSAAWCEARFLSHGDLERLAAPYGPATIDASLYAPGAFPGLTLVGPWLEFLGHLAPRFGAFKLVVVEA